VCIYISRESNTATATTQSQDTKKNSKSEYIDMDGWRNDVYIYIVEVNRGVPLIFVACFYFSGLDLDF
jgi:hypothetical protein